MIRCAQQIVLRIDRLLPALFVGFLLSAQNLVAVGAADSLIHPELVGPDGRTLTFADICNNAGENTKADKYCGGCAASKSSATAPVFRCGLAVHKLALVHEAGPKSFQPDTPERWQYSRRGPPIS